MSEMPQAHLDRMGQSGRDYYEQQGKDWMVELEQIEREKDAKALLLGVIEKAINEGASNGDQE
jgi:hypothetical protein